MFRRIAKQLFTLPQYFLPHHLLSRLMYYPTHSHNIYWKNFIIERFIKFYGVNMADAAEEDPTAYPTFNAFFTRALKKNVRPVNRSPNAIVCPADGTLSQIGNISEDKLLQAKGKFYDVTELLGGSSYRALHFQDGKFATIYLAPKDYHRLHMPLTGKLSKMGHIPGRLFSVNQSTTDSVNNLFARNERVVTVFETPAGPMALVMVGAVFVASIETVWHGIVTPPTQSTIRSWNYNDKNIELAKNTEMGRFNMGSTIIILFGQNSVKWSRSLKPGQALKLGQTLGLMTTD